MIYLFYFFVVVALISAQGECKYGGMCTMFSPEHIASVNHSAIPCRYGVNCTDNTTAHCMKFSHPKKRCPYGVECNKSSDSAHMKFFSHPFLPPCKNKYHCKEMGNREHMKTFSHICKWGAQCRDIRDPNHTLYYLHEKKTMCKWGDKCRFLATCDLDHCLCYSHKGLPDIRDKCSNSHCTDFSSQHRAMFFHPSRGAALCPLRGLNSELLLPQLNYYANIKRYNKLLDEIKSTGILCQEFVSYVRRFLPLHRCKPETMEYILKHESLVSLAFQNEMAENPVDSALTELKGNQRLGDILKKSGIDWTNKNLFVWVRLLAEVTLTKAGSTREVREKCRAAEEVMEDALGDNFSDVKKNVMRVINTVKDHKVKGIGCRVDKALGTDRNVFAVMGPTKV